MNQDVATVAMPFGVSVKIECRWNESNCGRWGCRFKPDNQRLSHLEKALVLAEALRSAHFCSSTWLEMETKGHCCFVTQFLWAFF